MLRISLSSLAVLTLTFACGTVNEDASGDSDASTNAIDAASPDAYVPAGDEYTVTWGPLTVQPGVEDTRCVTVRLGNANRIRAGAIHNVLGATSHHFIVYRVSDTEEKLDPYPCQPFVDTFDPAKGAPLMISQVADETLTLPEGVAFTLEADQMIRLEMHYINATDMAQELTASTTFVDITDTLFEQEADFLFIGNPDIEIPPMQTMTLGPTYFPLPSEFEGSKFFGITGHTHQWGTNVYVAATSAPDGADTPVYDLDNFFWDEPETVMSDPGFEVPAGGGFRFTCEWNNQSSQTVSFGESANDEMCFFWAYYYPSVGAKICIHTDQVNGGLDVCCPGDALCAIIQSQL